MPVWANKRKHLLSNEDRELIKKLLYYLEQTSMWEDFMIFGLCQLVYELRESNQISVFEYKEFNKLIYKIHPNNIYPNEFKQRTTHWFNRQDKKIRIKYLKRLLKE